jgi:hypothetical protein
MKKKPTPFIVGFFYPRQTPRGLSCKPNKLGADGANPKLDAPKHLIVLPAA